MDLDIENIDYFNYFPVQSKNVTEGDVCTHSAVCKIDSGNVCTDCGMIISQLDYSFDKNEEGNRCQYKNCNLRCIDDVIFRNNIQLCEIALDEIDKKYRVIVKKEKSRGKGRDALIAICLLFYWRYNGENKTLDDMKRMFGVTRKDLSASLSRYYRFYPEDRTIYLHPEDLVRRILIMQNIDLKYEKKIVEMCKILKDKSKLLNRSTPQSVATSVTYLYFKHHKECHHAIVDKKLFAKKACLSEITIDKIVKEIQNLFSLQ